MIKIHIHKSEEAGIFANAYIVETDYSLIVVDCTLTKSEAWAFGQELYALKKPIAAVLITHAHPDHIAGLAVWLRDPETPIYALAGVQRLLREIEEPKRAQWQPVFGDEWVSKWIHPNRAIGDGESINVDGTEFRVHNLGAGGDCDANSIWIIRGETRAAFVGDLVFSGTHSYLADGHINEWLKNLERSKNWIAEGSIIYPGHGEPGDLSLLDAQARYLSSYRQFVQELSDGRGTLTDEQRSELERRVKGLISGEKLAFMIGLSANVVAKEIFEGGQNLRSPREKPRSA